MNNRLESACNDLWQHLTLGRLSWLFGAGISFEAKIPLMIPLTKYVKALINQNNQAELPLFVAVEEQLPEDSHIEHILSQIGDLVTLAERSRNKSTVVNGQTVSSESLRALHGVIVNWIAYAVRYGYRPKIGDAAEEIGEPGKPIVKVDGHRAFIRALFAARNRSGLPPALVTFFTANYDTLLEDALALEKIHFCDGFVGGGMAYWDPRSYHEAPSQIAAKVYKLHGSVDWHRDDGSVFRCRDGCAYPDKADNLLIYPQSTKYVATQKDPFATLFGYFRNVLAQGPNSVIGICGYSFGDEHINGEIEAALAAPNSKAIVIAFVEERKSGDQPAQLPDTLKEWLSGKTWSDRVFVASSLGLYHGSLQNLYETPTRHDWWTFAGLTAYLSSGPEVITTTPESNPEMEAVE